VIRRSGKVKAGPCGAESGHVGLVRSACRADLAALVALERELFHGDRLSRASLRRFIDSRTARLLVSEAEERVVGYALLLFRSGSRVARLYSIGRKDQALARGVGTRLLEAIEAAARENGAGEIRLEVRSDNKSAIAFYRGSGFRVFDRRPRYYEDGADALRMKKSLDE
jgi:[ribosomal protein S18]-alanine N-acetyltransferase